MHEDQQSALRTLTTARLLLRPFTQADAPMILRIASDPETTRYLYFWGRIGFTPETDAERFLEFALSSWHKSPQQMWEYCVVNKATGEPMGEGSVEWVEYEKGTAELGWILLPEFRGRGYATEMGKELMRAAFEVMGAERVIAHCDARNAPSYRVMERLGMRLHSVEKEARPAKSANEKNGDECTYLISRDKWQLQNAWAEYRTYACKITDFVPLPPMRNGAVSLALERTEPADPVKKYVPAYRFHIMADGRIVGGIDLRLGYPDSLFYGGQIGYRVDEAFRGRGYAGEACRLLRPLLRAHGMPVAIISNDVNNHASRRVCEKLGARLLCDADVPPENELYQKGSRRIHVFAFDAEEK